MRRVLIPYDFSPYARRALALALSGVPFGPDVVIDALHVVDDRLYSRPGVEPPSDSALDGYFRAEVQRAATPERRVSEAPTLKIARGRPATEILNRLGDYGGIMIGGQGHGGLSEKFLGTTAVRVVRDSPVSVYVAKKSQSLATPGRVLCALESDDTSRRALKEAYALCRQCNASLALMRSIMLVPVYTEWPVVVPPPDARVVNTERERLISFEIDTTKESFATQHDVQFTHGGIAGDITHRALLDRIDTIVVGAHSQSVGKRLLGSTSESVVQRASCDVFVVR
ncbi:MAG: universal stress protein [Deltaproteobacteria bacterium]|nr:universal stress protein [Deltaproteobacteria bacterium]